MHYDGPPLRLDAVSLVAPMEHDFEAALRTADLVSGEGRWFNLARHDAGCLLFGICLDGRLIGQIFLHDADWPSREAMVGYHIFRVEHRRRGTGSRALHLLCAHAERALGLRRLVIITSIDNAASRALAGHADFRYIGPAREGEHLAVYERIFMQPALALTSNI